MEGGEKCLSEYKFCMRNFTVAHGSHTIDGCLEFLAADESDGGNLLCAACGCHRSFHWKKIKTAPHFICSNPLRAARMPQAATTPGAAENIEEFKRRRRGRTKFTYKQKERMRSFAESLGWRMANCVGDEEMEKFLEETGVSHRVFKVWMHNHRKEASKFRVVTVFSNSTEYNNNGGLGAADTSTAIVHVEGMDG